MSISVYSSSSDCFPLVGVPHPFLSRGAADYPLLLSAHGQCHCVKYPSDRLPNVYPWERSIPQRHCPDFILQAQLIAFPPLNWPGHGVTRQIHVVWCLCQWRTVSIKRVPVEYAHYLNHRIVNLRLWCCHPLNSCKIEYILIWRTLSLLLFQFNFKNIA